VLSSFYSRPIHNAIDNNYLEIVKYLVENGADISVEREGKTLLDIATSHDLKDIVNYLKGKLMSVFNW